ncbi:tRNA lysidine(34) synthetase TilS [Akkermansiaceae bacterium]|nr:tRNA lysidine(34) synthetase TilS [Akkermansiaceae bacterium]MDC0290587.1 tRNA lysidine(34) synthetase TilS [Akkermansiaceae bacterium]
MAALHDISKAMIPLPKWLDPKKPYLLGISGGRDSIALHHWLVENGFQKIIYCHLNHELREDESDDDERFLRQLLGADLMVGRVNVTEMAESKSLSLETAARDARHRFFQNCASQTGINHILLAHHADDQAETLLFNLLRGAAGLKGMKERQGLGALTFLRPFLEIRREAINQYLASFNHSFRDDSSNLEPFATRNRLRNEVIPLLSEIMKRDITTNILRASHHHRELEDAADIYLSAIEILDPPRKNPPSYSSESSKSPSKAINSPISLISPNP